MNLGKEPANLDSMGDEERRARNARIGAGKAKQFGVVTGDLRTLASRINTGPALPPELRKSGSFDAQRPAIVPMKPMPHSGEEVRKLVRGPVRAGGGGALAISRVIGSSPVRMTA